MMLGKLFKPSVPKVSLLVKTVVEWSYVPVHTHMYVYTHTYTYTYLFFESESHFVSFAGPELNM